MLTIVIAIISAIILFLFVQKFLDRVIIGKNVRWAIGVYRGSSPFDMIDPDDIDNPVLTRYEVNDLKAKFVADPFMVQEDGIWHMFFEVLEKGSGIGKIALATSQDGRRWRYEKIVINESFHLSYPYIIKWEGEYYMVPESGRTDSSVRLYKAVQFPDKWEMHAVLLSGQKFADASLLWHENKWWMFVSESTHSSLSIYFSEKLEGPFLPHPQNPVRENDKIHSRPGGRIFNYQGKIIRFAQQAEPWYGKALWAMEITQISETEFSERLYRDKPVLEGKGYGWNARRMHHMDPHQLPDGSWIAAVDGGDGKHHFRWVDRVYQFLFR